MPNGMKKRCGYRGCPKTTWDRYCEEHGAPATAYYDRRRGSTKERGCDADWRRLAQIRRELDAYLCQRCLAEGRLTTLLLVDHIVPIHIRPDWRLELGNTQALCPECHTPKTSEDLRRYGKRTGVQRTQQQSEDWQKAQRPLRPPRDGDRDAP